MNNADNKKDNLTKWLKCAYYVLGIAEHLGFKFELDKVIQWIFDAIKSCCPHDP